MVRVLFVEHKHVFGGGQVSLLSLFDGLDKGRVEVVAVCQPGSAIISELRKRRINTYVLNLGDIHKSHHAGAILRTLAARIVPTLGLIRLIVREGVDVVYANGAFSLISSLLATKLTRTPVIWSEHNTTLPLSLEIRLLIGVTDRIVVVTEVIRQQFVSLCPKASGKIVTIHNGVDPKRFAVKAQDRERLKQELGLRNEHRIIGTVGRLSPEKGHYHFLQAAALIREAIPGAKFLIVGSGPLRKRLEVVAEEIGVFEDVRFTGFREDVPALLSLMDIFVLPSLEEAFSIAVLEAMVAGKPVIASNVGGLYEAVVDGVTGFLVAPGDWAKMAELAIELLRDEAECRHMGERGRQLAAHRYTLGMTCAETLRLITELVGER